jgi:hypothetical protein
MQDSGKPEDSSGGETGGAKIRGNPEIYSPVPPKDARFEATRRSIAGTAGRCRIRGNPEPHRKAGRDDAWFRNLLVYRD